MFSNRSF